MKPAPLETTCSNAVEKYSLIEDDDGKGHDIDIDFKYSPDEDPLGEHGKVRSLPQKGWVQGDDRLRSGDWKVSPLWPIKMGYPIIELDEKQYSYAVVGYHNRKYCWIMSRTPVMGESLYTDIKKRLVEKHQYDLAGLRKVPQIWSEQLRSERGLTSQELPDSFLN